MRRKAKHFLRPLGLRWGRVLEWLRVVRSLDRRISAREWALMAWLVARSLFQRPAPAVANYRRCIRCVFHNRKLKSCAICNCHMPLKLAAGGGCAAREAEPDSPYGF